MSPQTNEPEDMKATAIGGRRLLYDRAEVAAMMTISLRTLDELVARGEIQVVRIGKAVRFTMSALEAFIEDHETQKQKR